MSAPAVHLVGALDTKGAEYAFVRDRIRAAGLAAVLIDTGVLDEPTVEPDIGAAAVARAAGAELRALRTGADRARAVTAMADGAARLLRERHAAGDVGAVLVLGGSNAGVVMSRIAAALPIGVPKLLVSTIVAGDTRPYVGGSDLMMLYPVVDIAGLNSVSTSVLARAADAVIGMLRGTPVPPRIGVRSIGCTMFGVTTACVSAVQRALERDGAEVQVFHANGTGGASFESLAASGAFDAVADVTTTELADELLGGVCTAGPHRLEAAGRAGVPQVVSVGALDMVNFGPPETVPERFRERTLLAHNPAVTLMRTEPDETAELGRILAAKLNAARGFVEVHVPALGFSQISGPGGPFHSPDADQALIESLRTALRDDIPLHIHDRTIDDPAFADEILLALDRARSSQKGR